MSAVGNGGNGLWLVQAESADTSPLKPNEATVLIAADAEDGSLAISFGKSNVPILNLTPALALELIADLRAALVEIGATP